MDAATLAERVVSCNDQNLEILPITEMMFNKSKTRPEERIATQLAKWDDSYRPSRPSAHRRWTGLGAAGQRKPFISYGHDMANAAAKAGLRYPDFIQRIVDAAVARYERS